jgi:hypothetical protein
MRHSSAASPGAGAVRMATRYSLGDIPTADRKARENRSGWG